MLKLSSLFLCLCLILLTSCASFNRQSNITETLSAKNDDKSKPAVMAKEILRLAEVIKQKEEELLKTYNALPDKTEQTPLRGFEGVSFYLGKSVEMAEEINFPYFNKKLLIKDIKDIDAEVKKFLRDSNTAGGK